MWLQISGPDATGKTLVAELLAYDGFQIIRHEPVVETHSFRRELEFLTRRLAAQLEAQKRMARENVVTIRSVWESALVFAPLAECRTEIQPWENEFIQKTFRTLEPQLEAPTAVIFVKSDKKMISMDRMLLKGERPDEERLRAQTKFYEDFAEQISVPVIELDASDKPERMKELLEFGVASLRASRLSANNFWRRDFLR